MSTAWWVLLAFVGGWIIGRLVTARDLRVRLERLSKSVAIARMELEDLKNDTLRPGK